MSNGTEQNKAMVWTGRIISILVALPLAFSAYMKVSGNPQVAAGMTHLGIPLALLTTLAILETLSVVLYLIPQTSIMGAIVLTGYMGGVIVTNLRVGENLVIPILLPILAWLGLYLREPRLRDLIPFRK